MTFLKYAISTTLISLLSACASTPAPDNTLAQNIPWEKRSQMLQKFQNWKLTGSASININNNTTLIRLNSWQQCGKNNYNITVSNLAGIGSETIVGTKNKVTLNKKSAPTPELLMQEQLGYSLPVNNLYFWIRGLPAPSVRSKIYFDPYHHIKHLTQENWEIQYLQYTQFNNTDLPSLIELKNTEEHIQLRMAISSWGLPQCTG